MEGNETYSFTSNPVHRNLVRFFTDFNLPQAVIIRVNSAKFLCSSVVLALQSDKFNELLTPQTTEIVLKEFTSEGSEVVIRHCLLFMYGGNIFVTIDNVAEICRFAVIYSVDSLSSECMKFVKCDINENPGNLQQMFCLIKILSEGDAKNLNNFQNIFNQGMKDHFPIVVDQLYNQLLGNILLSTEEIGETYMFIKTILSVSPEVSVGFGSFGELLILLVSQYSD